MKIPMKEVYKMRLYNIYYLCSNLLEIFKKDRMTVFDNGRSFYIEEWLKYTEALESIKQIPMFNEIATQIYESIPVFVREKDRPSIDKNTRDNFIKLNNMVVIKMETIISLYDSMNLNTSNKGIDVKIPQCTELKEYLGYIKDIDFIFTQCPYLLCETEQIQFSNVDVGSNWLSFIIKASGIEAIGNKILNNLATLVDKALILKSHFTSIRQQEEMLKMMKQKNTLLNEEIDIFKTLKKGYMEQIMNELSDEISPLENGEEKNKTEKSLEKLADLFDKGVEIFASIDTPAEVQVLFPELGNTKKLPKNTLKYIEEKNSVTSEENN